MISRQRVHQIKRNYKNIGRGGREIKYKNWGKCKDCNEKEAELLHHKDFDNSNDDIKNLIRLCGDCHYLRHTFRKFYKNDIRFIKRVSNDYKKGLPNTMIFEKYRISRKTFNRILAY